MSTLRSGQSWLWITLAVVVVIGLGALAIRTIPSASNQPLSTTPTQAAVPTSTPTQPTPTSLTTRIFLLTEQNASGQNGTVTLTEENGKTLVAVSITPSSSTTPQPAHIHTGACPTPGAIKYPLTSVVNGKSTTTINAKLTDLATQLPLALNVHRSAAETAVYISCGDLVF